MPDPFRAAEVSDIPAITITAVFKVRPAGMCSKRVCEHFPADEFFGVKRQVPFKEIPNRRVNTAVAQNRAGDALIAQFPDRKSTRLNSSHVSISYAVFCLKKKM